MKLKTMIIIFFLGIGVNAGMTNATFAQSTVCDEIAEQCLAMNPYEPDSEGYYGYIAGCLTSYYICEDTMPGRNSTESEGKEN